VYILSIADTKLCNVGYCLFSWNFFYLDLS